MTAASEKPTKKTTAKKKTATKKKTSKKKASAAAAKKTASKASTTSGKRSATSARKTTARKTAPKKATGSTKAAAGAEAGAGAAPAAKAARSAKGGSEPAKSGADQTRAAASTPAASGGAAAQPAGADTGARPLPKPARRTPPPSKSNDNSHAVAPPPPKPGVTLFGGIIPYTVEPGEPYMNDRQLAHFRNILLAWKRELMEEVDRTVLHMKDEAANFPDPNDRATQESEFSLELRTRDRERKLIKKIEEALTVVEAKEYGYCEACGIEIGIRRLEARPTATLCIDCKTLDEIRERQMG